MSVQHLVLANDLGYSTIKAIANKITVKMPSEIAIQREQDLFDSTDFSELNSEDQNQYMATFLDRLDVSINSTSVALKSRMLVGSNAVSSGLPLTSFDVNDLSGKSDNDLSVILTLSLIAGESVYEYYDNHHNLPSDIKVNVDMATALPILEGKRNHAIDDYRDRFLNGTHEVILNNFTQPIKVTVHFNKVVVALEGETAQYEIKYAIPELKKEIKQDFDAHYPVIASDITAQDLTSEGNVLGIDIGEGTTDYVVFNNGSVNLRSSNSLARGYGNALEEAVDELKSQRFNIGSRSQLQAVLSERTTNLNRARHQTAQKAVDNQMNQLASAIVDGASQTLRKASASVNLIYVYGGGATPLEPYLRNKLMEKTRQFAAGDDIFVIWISKNFAQFLNEGGLQVILSKILG